MGKQEINIVWFKRDFRLSDHAPLAAAIEEGKPLLLVAFLEPSLMNVAQSDIRHWRFVRQSISDMNNSLLAVEGKVELVQTEVIPFFQYLADSYHINKVFSYQETGIQITYDRDLKTTQLFHELGIEWVEFPYAGVIRGIKRRSNWPKHWYTTMAAKQDAVDLSRLKSVSLNISDFPQEWFDLPKEIEERPEGYQIGGESLAKQYLSSFLKDRVSNYNQHISKPALSRKSCSRLSPYLAWGNLSMRQVYQAAVEAKKSSDQKWNINSFMSRLRWHCHFIQKFEMMERYERENINPGYNELRTDWDENKYLAWERGQTGYPLIDACMRCLKSTGYINFRMRSMLVSFLTHHLWLHWKRGADYLASLFLDFEPGIHYAQFQMQAGTTGYNTVRIYNPVKQSKDSDAEGVFIKQWVPEISQLPLNFLLEPWKMSEMEQQMNECVLGKDYPMPVVDIKATYKSASKALWGMKKNPTVRKEARKILAKQDEEARPIDG